VNTDRPIQFRAPRVEPSNVPLIGEEDGGLSLRQMFRSVKDRMTTDGFKFGGKTTDGKYVPPSKMTCADCNELKLSNIRSFRSWSSLRDHLIAYHGRDRRELPE